MVAMAMGKPELSKTSKGFLKESTGFDYNKKYDFGTTPVNNRPMIGVLTQPLTDA